MADKVTITFTIEDADLFKKSYRKALESSGYSKAEQATKLEAFDHGQALAEVIADSFFHWEEHGLGY